MSIRKPALSLNDKGNAHRFIALAGSQFRYDIKRHKWFHCNGALWETDKARARAYDFALKAVDRIKEEAIAENDPDRKRVLYQWRCASGNRTRLDNMLAVAGQLFPLRVLPHDFDRDPFLLNCRNGIVDLRTGKLLPHDPEHLLTKICGTSYDPDAKSHLWSRFLIRTAAGKPSLRRFLQQAVGYSLTADAREDASFWLFGPGDTGKSTFLQAVQGALGDYAATVDFRTLAHRNGSGDANPELVRLFGARFILCSEVERGQRLALGQFKRITGGDTIVARGLYQEPFEFAMTGKVWIACNDLPIIPASDAPAWKRIHCVPFKNVIPKADKDRQMRYRLRTEQKCLRAILAWAVRGCQSWYESGTGLCVPECIRQETEQCRESYDEYQPFLDECCKLSQHERTPVADMWSAFQQWAARNRVTANRRDLNECLRRHGCANKLARIHDDDGARQIVKCWHGVGLVIV